ncbi:MAG: polysaccharide biosynthesis/export family protein [Planctomycetes bacterium]|nr:polysaccharide biosynthesis/export family protein [Planctomycetota bacterium]MBL7007981.1 polysaccharide biosynthesis/export family protein [Planctomycetota bacterium]
MQKANAFLATSLLLLSAGCASVVTLNSPFEGPPATPLPAPYRISPGDGLTLEFSRVFVPVEDYHLGVNDRLSIHVQKREDLQLDTTIAPDGTVAFHFVARFKAVGKTIDEVQKILQDGLVAAGIAKATVDVFLVEGDTLTQEFIDMLLRSPTGSTRALSVNRGGMISLPGTGQVKVAGFTLEELETELNRMLQERMPSLQVIVNSSFNADAMYTVVGEVMRPGTFTMAGDVSLIEALASAGWETEYGELSRVLLMSRGEDDVIDANLYDVDDALAHGNPLPMVRVRPRDVVVILRTGVGNTNRAIEQYIRRNLPINLGASYRLNTPN